MANRHIDSKDDAEDKREENFVIPNAQAITGIRGTGFPTSSNGYSYNTLTIDKFAFLERQTTSSSYRDFFTTIDISTLEVFKNAYIAQLQNRVAADTLIPASERYLIGDIQDVKNCIEFYLNKQDQDLWQALYMKTIELRGDKTFQQTHVTSQATKTTLENPHINGKQVVTKFIDDMLGEDLLTNHIEREQKVIEFIEEDTNLAGRICFDGIDQAYDSIQHYYIDKPQLIGHIPTEYKQSAITVREIMGNITYYYDKWFQEILIPACINRLREHHVDQSEREPLLFHVKQAFAEKDQYKTRYFKAVDEAVRNNGAIYWTGTFRDADLELHDLVEIED